MIAMLTTWLSSKDWPKWTLSSNLKATSQRSLKRLILADLSIVPNFDETLFCRVGDKRGLKLTRSEFLALSHAKGLNTLQVPLILLEIEVNFDFLHIFFSVHRASGALGDQIVQFSWDFAVGLLKESAKRSHDLFVILGEEGGGETVHASASGTADTVGVFLDVVRKIEIDNVRNALDV